MKTVLELIRFCKNLTVDDCYSYGNIRPFTILPKLVVEISLVTTDIKNHENEELFSKLDDLCLLNSNSVEKFSIKLHEFRSVNEELCIEEKKLLTTKI